MHILCNRSICLHSFFKNIQRRFSSEFLKDTVAIGGHEYKTDSWTNVTPSVLSHIGKNLHHQHHPLGHIKRRILQFTYERFVTPRGNPLFSIHDDLSPVVSVEQNFDSLLVPKDHISRQHRDNYYVNQNFILRGHTTAHQSDLIRMGLDCFLIAGDVYRRDEINATHYKVFHQLDGVRLFNKQDLFKNQDLSKCNVFESSVRTDKNQGVHSPAALQILIEDLRNHLVDLILHLFGKDVKWRWNEDYFPFTNPSWELEILFEDEWIEILGCGIIEQEILRKAGAGEKVGWAFGIGLERLAMKLYKIPDIRLFWLNDKRFLFQFDFEDPNTPVEFKPIITKMGFCYLDISFWLPDDNAYSSQDFYELAQEEEPSLIEEITQIDEFVDPKTKRISHCYRILYRSWERVLTVKEVDIIHRRIAEKVAHTLCVEVR